MKKRTAKKAIFIIMLAMLISSAYAQSYTTYVESSSIGRREIGKTPVIWIIADTSNFMWNRTIETAIRDKFKINEIKTFLTTDFMDICDLKENQLKEIVSLYVESKSDFMLTVEIDDLYTYSAGGGIKSLEITSNLIDFENGTTMLKMALSTEADTNDLKSLNETRRPAIESMAESLTREFMK